MFICETDKRLMFLRFVLSEALKGRELNLSPHYDMLFEAAKKDNINDLITTLKKIPGIRILKAKDETYTKAFYDGDKWFAEAMCSLNSVGYLFNQDTGESIAVLAYDKEYKIYVIDFVDPDLVDITLPQQSADSNFTRRMCDAPWLMDRFNRGIVIQG